MKLITPKLDFLQSPDALEFEKIIANPTFLRAIQTAELQFLHDMPMREGLEEACRQNYLVHGAKQFALTLLNLLTVEDPQPQLSSTSLKWQQQPRRPLPQNPPAPLPPKAVQPKPRVK